ncbi:MULTISPECIES: hypothetical protein [Kitasatospora]|uniref:Uncharacterized protein n=1 Tax=Kitasatospora setae (strain ATCC 33774 / DSM 43861 / JCM 3304 / KCC A-0304 / NBRC 14216 / KM-6054) TaxID=452652 RepID=E4N5Z3_KITSK|nr:MULTISPECIES: hypothetical protein [Kitasatospora]BAJ26624.1 hypothetical protein KSE_07850 [Kitasatospora setae KM-6054]
METDEVMLAVRLTTAERTLLRRLARGHRGDVSEVVADALLDVLPMLLTPPGREDQFPWHTSKFTAPPSPFAPCAVTVWLPPELAELLPALAARLAGRAAATGSPAPLTPCAALGTALRLWLRQDPERLAAGLHALHCGAAHAHPHAQPQPHPASVRQRPVAA